MPLTIRDCCALPSLAMAQVIAGHKGLDQAVDSVSVLEWMDLKAFHRQFFLQNEVVITSFYSFRGDVDSQLLAIRKLKESGEVGMILYYVGVILPKVDEKIKGLADELDFPIIMMPPNRMDLRYSEAIQEISEAIRRNRAQNGDFVQNALARLAGVPEIHRTVSTVLRMLSDQLQMTLLLADNHYGDFVAAAWPLSLSLPLHELLEAYTNGAEHPSGYAVVAEQPVNNSKWQHAKLLAVSGRDTPISRTGLAQAAKVLELTFQIWKSYEFDNYSADLIGAIINGEEQSVRRLLRRHGMTSFPFRTLWVIVPKGGEGGGEKLSMRLTAAYKALKKRMTISDQHHHLAVFDGFLVGILTESKPQEEAFFASLAEQRLFCVQLCPLFTLVDFQQAFERTLNVGDTAAHIYREAHMVTSQEMLFSEEIRACMNRGPEAVSDALHVLRPLTEAQDKGAALIDTLAVFFLDCEADVDRTAEKLFLHRNTVKYRLQKAEGKLGFPVQRFPNCIELYRALAIARIKR